MRYTILAAVAACAVLLAAVIYADVKRTMDCHAREGKMVHDGTFTYVWHVTDYNTGMGVLVPHPNYKCSADQ